jgi:ATP-dependent 26S proteasome regulatory subunit
MEVVYVSLQTRVTFGRSAPSGSVTPQAARSTVHKKDLTEPESESPDMSAGATFSVLREIFESHKRSGEMRSLGLRSCSGVLLHGPPGVGKTFAVRAVASSCGLPLTVVKGSELLDATAGVRVYACARA